jgi:hypothetical protein
MRGRTPFIILLDWRHALELRINKDHAIIHQLQVVSKVEKVPLEYLHQFVDSLRLNIDYKRLWSCRVCCTYYQITKILANCRCLLPGTNLDLDCKCTRYTEVMLASVHYLLFRRLRGSTITPLTERLICLGCVILLSDHL